MKTAYAYAVRFLVGVTIGLVLCLLIDIGKEAQRVYEWLDATLPNGDA